LTGLCYVLLFGVCFQPAHKVVSLVAVVSVILLAISIRVVPEVCAIYCAQLMISVVT